MKPLPAAPVLYQRGACHLCDLSLAVLAEAGCPEFHTVFIDGDDALEAQFGTRVPVLTQGPGAELDWPFDAAEVQKFLTLHSG